MKRVITISILCALCIVGTAKDKNFKVVNFNKTELSLQKHNTPFEVKSNTLLNNTTEGDRPFIKRAMFNMYIDWNFHLGSVSNYSEQWGASGFEAGFTWGGGMYFTFGARIFDYVFVGAGFGSELLPALYNGYGDYIWQRDIIGFFNIPTFLNVRAFLPATNRIFPYIDIAAGPSCLFYLNYFDDIYMMPLATFLRAGIGVDFSRFSLGLGYEGLFGKYDKTWAYYNRITGERTSDYYTTREKLGIHTFYLKLGIRIGSME